MPIARSLSFAAVALLAFVCLGRAAVDLLTTWQNKYSDLGRFAELLGEGGW